MKSVEELKNILNFDDSIDADSRGGNKYDDAYILVGVWPDTSENDENTIYAKYTFDLNWVKDYYVDAYMTPEDELNVDFDFQGKTIVDLWCLEDAESNILSNKEAIEHLGLDISEEELTLYLQNVVEPAANKKAMEFSKEYFSENSYDWSDDLRESVLNKDSFGMQEAFVELNKIYEADDTTNNEVNSRVVKCSKEELEYLGQVMGQLSDGKWENSPRMEPYWRCNSIVDDGIKMKQYYSDRYIKKSYYNPLYNKSDIEVREWFANRLKDVVKDWLEDNNGGEWERSNPNEVDYLGRGQTVGGAYKVYDSLKGRVSRSGKQFRSKATVRAMNLEIGNIIGKRTIQKVIQPLTPKDNIVTVIYDTDEVDRFDKYQSIDIIVIKTAI